jgi:hypothetical protein
MQTEARHADAELRINTKAAPKPEARQARDTKNAELAASATAMRERNAAAAQTPAESEALPPPREDVESIEVKLLDGRMVEFGPPPGISLTMRIAMTIPDATSNPVIDRLARVCMCIRTIDGKQPRQIANIVDLTAVANMLGDVPIDELAFWYDKHWGQVRISDLQLLKKNLRGA